MYVLARRVRAYSPGCCDMRSLFDKQQAISLMSLAAKSGVVLTNVLLPGSHVHFYQAVRM